MSSLRPQRLYFPVETLGGEKAFASRAAPPSSTSSEEVVYDVDRGTRNALAMVLGRPLKDPTLVLNGDKETLLAAASKFRPTAEEIAKAFVHAAEHLPERENGKTVVPALVIPYPLALAHNLNLQPGGDKFKLPGFLYVQAKELFDALMRKGVREVVFLAPEVVETYFNREAKAQTSDFASNFDFQAAHVEAAEQREEIGEGKQIDSRTDGPCSQPLVEHLLASSSCFNPGFTSKDDPRLTEVYHSYSNHGRSVVWLPEHVIPVLAQAAKEAGLKLKIGGFRRAIEFNDGVESPMKFYGGVQAKVVPNGYDFVGDYTQFTRNSEIATKKALQATADVLATDFTEELSDKGVRAPVVVIGTMPSQDKLRATSTHSDIALKVFQAQQYLSSERIKLGHKPGNKTQRL